MTPRSPGGARLCLFVLGTVLAMLACSSSATPPILSSPTVLHDEPMSPLPRPTSPGPTTIAIPHDDPSGGPPAPGSTHPPRPTPKPTPSLRMDTTNGPSLRIQPGKSRSVPIAFEGTARGQVTLLTESGSSIKATFDGKAIPRLGTFFGIAQTYGLDLDHPADGILRVTNTGKKSVDVGTMIWVLTSRHLDVTISKTFVAKGEPATVEVVLSDPVAGDTVTLEDTGAAGLQAPIALVAQGGGHWTGSFASTISGEHNLFARTIGPAQRLGSGLIQVLSGDVTLGPGFTERLEDADGDGLADMLVLALTITVKTAGSYDVVADIVDGNGELVDRITGVRPLAAGTHPLDLSFDGKRIYESGTSGPYKLVDVYVINGSGHSMMEAGRLDFGATSAFRYEDFQH